MNDLIEQEIQAKGLTAPRVTPADIEAEIVAEYGFTIDHAMLESPVVESAKCLTIRVLVLKNGFTVVGKSACASPANFDAELGHKIARQDAINQIWPLLGFRLRDQLAGLYAVKEAVQQDTWLDRVMREREQLAERIDSLAKVLAAPRPSAISPDQWDLLVSQKHHMTFYLLTLDMRISNAASGQPTERA